jgi:hypothetical protein
MRARLYLRHDAGKSRASLGVRFEEEKYMRGVSQYLYSTVSGAEPSHML